MLYKSRLVALGNLQDETQFDENKISSPVMNSTTCRALFAKSAINKWSIHHLDVVTAYLNSPLPESDIIFMGLPKELVLRGYPRVVQLRKALYGLRQSGYLWNQLMTEFLLSTGFKQCLSDPCLFVDEQKDIFLGLYVDDSFITGPDAPCAKIIEQISKRFKTTNKGLMKKFLGINVDQSSKGVILINQKDYIIKILEKCKMLECYPTLTPAVPHSVLSAPIEKLNSDTYPYSSIVGQLLWISIMTRPDIAYQVGQLTRFISNYGQDQISAVKYVLRYLKGTMNKSIKYDTNCGENLLAYTDATWANDSDMRSVSGNVFILGGGAISWLAKSQSSVALSSCASEYFSCSEAAKEAVYKRMLLKDLRFKGFTGKDIPPINIKCDNQPAILVAYGTNKHAHVKHILLRIQYLRELIKENLISLTYVPSSENVADALTKNIAKPQFTILRSLLLGN